MEMNKLFSIPQEMLDKLLEIPITPCSISNENCPTNKMNVLIEEYKKMELMEYIKQQIYFIESVSSVYEDGRSCSANVRRRQLLKLTNDDWRKDIAIVSIGLRYGIINLNRNDIIKLN